MATTPPLQFDPMNEKAVVPGPVTPLSPPPLSKRMVTCARAALADTSRTIRSKPMTPHRVMSSLPCNLPLLASQPPMAKKFPRGFSPWLGAPLPS